MPHVQRTPLQLAKRTLLGCAITAAAYFVAFLPFAQPKRHLGLAVLLQSARLELLCVALPMLVGVLLTYLSNHRLTSGINRLRFSEEQLDEARAFVRQRWLTYLQVLLFILVFVLSAVQLTQHVHPSNGAIILLLAANPLNYMRSTLSRPVTQSAPIDWSLAQPIRSDHWGQTR